MSARSTQGLIGMLEERRTELHRFLVARTGSEADADDLLSELWIKINAAHPGPIASPKNYLFRMANNLVLDRFRETRRRERREVDWTAERHGSGSPALEVADTTPNAEEVLAHEHELRLLAEAIAKLPSGAQRVLRLHKIEGLGHAQVAERLHISRSAVEKHMAVAMTHLRRLLATEAVASGRRLENGKVSQTIETGVKQ